MTSHLNLKNYVTSWRKRNKLERQNNYKRYQQARKTIPIIIEILKKYEVEKIFLFGSACQQEKFNRHSDIDIAVLGLSDQKFFKAYGELIMNLDFEIDLKPYEKLDQLMKDRILKQGEVIYVRAECNHNLSGRD